MKQSGKVYLVGSGPGDERLITVGAVEALRRADVVIYDNLINESLLGLYCSRECELLYVGKSGKEHTLEQDEINELIVAKARSHEVVVRLKGGDPFIFGRGGEEAMHLRSHGIDYEVICGISSAYAVPAYAGIPVTHRGYSSSVAFITGHEDPTKDKSDINWEKLATGVQTLVFLMGVKNIPLIMEQLTKHGRDRSTPVAVIQNGTYPAQKTVTGTVATIAEIVTREKIAPPSIVVVGEVVSLREELNWFETRPLFGRTIVVTRSRDQASVLVEKLRALGAGVMEMPAILIEGPEDPAALEDCIRGIGRYQWIIFTSANGVTHFFARLTALGLDARALAERRICAIGPATAAALESRGIRPDHMPAKFVSTEVVRELSELGEVAGKSFLLPRADIAPDTMREDLLALGASRVDDIAAYRTVAVEYGGANPLAEAGDIDLVTFTSSSTVRNFMRAVRETPHLKGIPCVAIGPVTAEAARREGCNVVAVADEYTIDGLVAAVLRHLAGDG
ncbi:MAG: uroporphyrinogen-III C-methyltransferase [Spirochaetes bacterium]|nr:uroporphyrinogen-III C-methyltransferase [Spirochaetota bacterium]